MDPLSRRSMLALAAAGAVAPSLAPAAAGTKRAAGPKSEPVRFAGAREELDAFVRVMGHRGGQLSPWWYTGYIYGVRPGEEPRKLVRFEGCEAYRFRRREDGAWVQTARTLTFFQDVETGAVLERFDNPYTGQAVDVRVNLLGGNGQVVLSEAGATLEFKGRPPLGPLPHRTSWTPYGGWVWMRTDRPYPPGLPQPIAESSAMLVERRHLADTKSDSIPALFSSSYLAPWLAWMQMPGAPGHTMWHADGVKIGSLDELPDAYRERAERLHPGHLAAL